MKIIMASCWWKCIELFHKTPVTRSFEVFFDLYLNNRLSKQWWDWRFICILRFMMTSSKRIIFRVTGPLCGEFTGHRWIPITKASEAELWWFPLICAWINRWVNNREVGDFGRHRAHYDVILMFRVTKLEYTTHLCTDAGALSVKITGNFHMLSNGNVKKSLVGFIRWGCFIVRYDIISRLFY